MQGPRSSGTTAAGELQGVEWLVRVSWDTGSAGVGEGVAETDSLAFLLFVFICFERALKYLFLAFWYLRSVIMRRN